MLFSTAIRKLINKIKYSNYHSIFIVAVIILFFWLLIFFLLFFPAEDDKSIKENLAIGYASVETSLVGGVSGGATGQILVISDLESLINWSNIRQNNY